MIEINKRKYGGVYPLTNKVSCDVTFGIGKISNREDY